MMGDLIDRDAALASIAAALNNATGDLYDAYAAIRSLPSVDPVVDHAAIRAAALREAAAVAIKEAEDCGPSYGDGYPQQSAHEIASAILALIDKEPRQ